MSYEPESFSNEDYKKLYSISDEDIPRKISIGNILQKSFTDEYISFLSRRVNIQKPLSLVIDTSNGVVGPFVKKLLQEPSFKSTRVKELFFDIDGSFPNHSPNPLEKKSQQFIKKEIADGAYDLGCIFDADGDRVVFVDEKGEVVRGDLITALIVDRIIQKNQTVLADLRSTRALFELGERRGVDIQKTKVGHVNIKTALKKARGEFAGELSGHYYFKEMNYSESALLMLIYVLNILSRNGEQFSVMLDKYKKYFHSGELNFEVEDREAAIDSLKNAYRDGEQSDLDGLSVEYENWWFNVRPSKTEPLIRLVVEADSKELLDEKIEELSEKIKSR